MEPWQRVWIDATAYASDVHSYINCTDCHGGHAVNDMDAAHTGMNPAPASDPETCGSCHRDVGPAVIGSLHMTLAGYDQVLHARSIPENHQTLEEMQEYHCNDCHATCGDCHVSQPASVGGGLLKGHTFVPTPPMSQTCTACHGSRVKNEYYGLNEGIPSDVHFRSRMACTDCHTANQIHGMGAPSVVTTETGAVEYMHRYDGAQEPACEDCHQDQVGIGSGVEMHEVHGTEILSCQACHSTTYTNCVNCHVERTDEGQPFYRIEDHFLGFYLAKNAERTQQRPYRFVPVRHVPIDKDSFSFYGEDLLPNFDALPTWAYATPHNIQLNTPQTASCEACHGNDDIFLTPDKVAPEEQAANARIVVEQAPPLPANYVPPVVEEPAETETGTGGGDDFWGGSDESEDSDSGGDDSFWGDEPSGEPAAPSDAGGDDDFWGGESTDETQTETSDDDFWGN
jgi:thiosulfate/3-mercaptopyruvate sulfurtransferase